MTFEWAQQQLSPQFNESCRANIEVLGSSGSAEVLSVRARAAAVLGAVCEFTMTVVDASGKSCHIS